MGVRDGRGATNAGIVTLRVQADTNTSPSFAIEDLGNGSFRAHFSGIPGRGYNVQAAATLQPPAWQTIGLATADSSGSVTFIDTPPGGTPRYYRLATPDSP